MGNREVVTAAFYRRSDLFDRRHLPMADWGAYVAWRFSPDRDRPFQPQPRQEPAGRPAPPGARL
ncbi:MAG: hypothetical protein OXQ29_08130 [Rhodospirillaceae bacterium]|nr:hypothetical protein [Rhodospirillaceae bacterium]